jgi:hypothetical protein
VKMNSREAGRCEGNFVGLQRLVHFADKVHETSFTSSVKAKITSFSVIVD